MLDSLPQHDCKDELNVFKLRATPARIALMSLLESTDKPLDTQTMIAHLEKKDIATNPATVFRIMNMFTDRGLTKQISFNEKKLRYELTSKKDHHHLICKKCGEVKDLSDCNISSLEKEIEKKKKFLVTSHSLEFFGICQSCQ